VVFYRMAKPVRTPLIGPAGQITPWGERGVASGVVCVGPPRHSSPNGKRHGIANLLAAFANSNS
jgi:hypothetical protein